MAGSWDALGQGLIAGAQNFVAGNRWQAEQKYKEELADIQKKIQDRQISILEAQLAIQQAEAKRQAEAEAPATEAQSFTPTITQSPENRPANIPAFAGGQTWQRNQASLEAAKTTTDYNKAQIAKLGEVNTFEQVTRDTPYGTVSARKYNDDKTPRPVSEVTAELDRKESMARGDWL
jgi:hypothetical protein